MQHLGRQPVAFTTAYKGRSNGLVNEVGISEVISTESLPPDPIKMFKAVWDTGATNSVITKEIVQACNLKPTGMVTVHTAMGRNNVPTYLVSIFLPNKVVIPTVRVSEGVVSECDVLVGMDIIGLGDFAVSNKDGLTVFSFRMPSVERIDFVQHPQWRSPASAILTGRNARCPCGSGKKYKKCHGNLGSR